MGGIHLLKASSFQVVWSMHLYITVETDEVTDFPAIIKF